MEQGVQKLDLAGSEGTDGGAKNSAAQVSKPAELTKEQFCNLSIARKNKLQVSHKKALPQDIQDAHAEIQKMIEAAQNSAKAHKMSGELCSDEMPMPKTQLDDCSEKNAPR